MLEHRNVFKYKWQLEINNKRLLSLRGFTIARLLTELKKKLYLAFFYHGTLCYSNKNM